MRVRTNHLGDFLPLIEEQEGGHGPDAKFLGDVGDIVYVDLVELGFWVVITEFFDFGGDGFAGAAPFGPGVEDDGTGVGVEDLLEEVFFARWV